MAALWPRTPGWVGPVRPNRESHSERSEEANETTDLPPPKRNRTILCQCEVPRRPTSCRSNPNRTRKALVSRALKDGTQGHAK